MLTKTEKDGLTQVLSHGVNIATMLAKRGELVEAGVVSSLIHAIKFLYGKGEDVVKLCRELEATVSTLKLQEVPSDRQTSEGPNGTST